MPDFRIGNSRSTCIRALTLFAWGHGNRVPSQVIHARLGFGLDVVNKEKGRESTVVLSENIYIFNDLMVRPKL